MLQLLIILLSKSPLLAVMSVLLVRRYQVNIEDWLEGAEVKVILLEAESVLHVVSRVYNSHAGR